MSNEKLRPLFTSSQEMINVFLDLGHVQHVTNLDDGDGKRVRTDKNGNVETGLDPVTVQKRASLDRVRAIYGTENVITSLPVNENGVPDPTNHHQLGVYVTAAAVWESETAQPSSSVTIDQAPADTQQSTIVSIAA